MTTYTCLEPTCDAHGTTTGTESGADVKHVAATSHAVMTSLRGFAAAGEGEGSDE